MGPAMIVDLERTLILEFGRLAASVVAPTDLPEYDELAGAYSQPSSVDDAPLGFGVPGNFDPMIGAALHIGIVVAGFALRYGATFAGEMLSDISDSAREALGKRAKAWIADLVGLKGGPDPVRPFRLPAAKATELLAAMKQAARDNGIREPALSKVIDRVQGALFD
jgi:hypothetical protein